MYWNTSTMRKQLFCSKMLFDPGLLVTIVLQSLQYNNSEYL